MIKIFKILSGDKTMWAIVGLLVLASFLPVYSTSSYLEYVVGKGTTFGYLLRHAVLLFVGLLIIVVVHRTPYNYFSGISIISLPVVILLLIITISKDIVIDGANASRWLQVPFVGISFQPSSLALVVLPVYISRYLAKLSKKEYNFWDSFYFLWVPTFVVCGLILPANLSTSILLFSVVVVLCFIGNYPKKDILKILGISLSFFFIFILINKAFPDVLPNSRVNTWVSRVEGFFIEEGQDVNKSYQIMKAKTAIANGGFLGVGAGKSMMKNFLPHSSSDFIFAIILEEYGMLGGVFLIGLYFILLLRMLVITGKEDSAFGKLVVYAVGFPILFSAFINMGVSVGIIPVTGQNLPLITSGGTSIWTTCLAIGIILSVSTKKQTPPPSEDIAEEEMLNPIDILSAQV